MLVRRQLLVTVPAIRSQLRHLPFDSHLQLLMGKSCWSLPGLKISAPLLAAPPQVLGFPVQLVGLLALPYLGVRWLVDGNDASKDIEAAAVRGVLL